MEDVRLVEDTALKAAGCNRLGGSSPSSSAIIDMCRIWLWISMLVEEEAVDSSSCEEEESQCESGRSPHNALSYIGSTSGSGPLE